MVTQIENAAGQLQELISLNNERSEGYKIAAEESKDEDLKKIFKEYSNQSLQFGYEIENLLPKNELMQASPEAEPWGKYSGLIEKDRKGILTSCDLGEDIAKRKYEEVLDHPHGIEIGAFNLIYSQQRQLKHAHHRIKAMKNES